MGAKAFILRACLAAVPLLLLSLAALNFFGSLVARYVDGIGGCSLLPVTYPAALSSGDQVTCVAVVGASSGVGKGIVQNLNAFKNVRFITTGRTKQRALDAAGDALPKVILAAGLELEDAQSVAAFVRDLRTTVKEKCPNGLGYIFMNAGFSYLPDDPAPRVTKDGKNDKLFASNFLGYVALLRDLVPDFQRWNTRTVFTNSFLHYFANPTHVLEPEKLLKQAELGVLKDILPYAASKLALTSLQQVLVRDNIVPNSVTATCGMVDSNIWHPSDSRIGKDGNALPWPLNAKGVFFTSIEGAKAVIEAAFLDPKVIGNGRQVFPYFFPYANSELIYNAYSGFLIGPEPFQKMSRIPGKAWVCPVSHYARNDTFLDKVREKYSLRW